MFRKSLYQLFDYLKMPQAPREALLEGLRVALFAGVSNFLTVVVPLLEALPTEQKTLFVLGLTMFFKGLDKFFHERAEKEGWLGKHGLSGF